MAESNGQMPDTTQRFVVRSVHNRHSSDQWHALHTIGPLSGEVESMGLQIQWRDQGWGNGKGRIRMALRREGSNIAQVDCFGIATHSKESARMDFDCSVDGQKVLRGDFIDFEYFVGGGGGHELHIDSFEVFIAGQASAASHSSMAELIGKRVFITSHRGEQLKDHDGRLLLTSAEQGWEIWTLTEAADGKFYITSHRQKQLKDHDGEALLTDNKQEWERWTLADAGDGKVFISSHRNEQLMDSEGEVRLTDDRRGWEKWTIRSALPQAPALEVAAPTKEAVPSSMLVEVHTDIICDGCEASPIIGTRYNSLEVPNYDLCERCFRATDRDVAVWARIQSEVHTACDPAGGDAHVDSAVYASKADPSMKQDVTEIVNSLVAENGAHNFTARRDLNAVLGDPAGGEEKVLIVTKGHLRMEFLESGKGGPSDCLYDLSLLKADHAVDAAIYGSAADASKSLDVTDLVNDLLARHGPWNLTGRQDLNDVFGDPASGEEKKLVLTRGSRKFECFEAGRGGPAEKVFDVTKLFQAPRVDWAAYVSRADTSEGADVTAIVNDLLVANPPHDFTARQDLNEVFGDPALGEEKKLVLFTDGRALEFFEAGKGGPDGSQYNASVLFEGGDRRLQGTRLQTDGGCTDREQLVVDRAVYMSIDDPSRAQDVTTEVNELIVRHGLDDFTARRELNEVFGDPAWGDEKKLVVVRVQKTLEFLEASKGGPMDRQFNLEPLYSQGEDEQYVVVLAEFEYGTVLPKGQHSDASIRRAWYGRPDAKWDTSEGKGMDITEKVKELLRAGQEVRASNELFTDPAPGRSKVVCVECFRKAARGDAPTAQTGPLIVRLDEYEEETLPASTCCDASVLRAWYGRADAEWDTSEGRGIDVTEEVKQLLRAGEDVRAANEIFTDPAPGARKRLCVELCRPVECTGEAKVADEVNDQLVAEASPAAMRSALLALLNYPRSRRVRAAAASAVAEAVAAAAAAPQEATEGEEEDGAPCPISNRSGGRWITSLGRRMTKTELLRLQGMIIPGFKAVEDEAKEEVKEETMVEPQHIEAEAEKKIQSADGEAVEDEAKEQAKEETMVEPQHIEAETEKNVQSADGEALPRPSACVLRCEPFTAATEAAQAVLFEDDSVRGAIAGDKLQALLHGLSAAAAGAAFCLGRAALPMGAAAAEDASVPFSVSFVLQNDGAVAWPTSAALVHIAGDDFGFPMLELGPLGAGEAAQLVMDLTVRSRNVRHGLVARSAWALLDTANGEIFGPVLTVEVVGFSP